MTGRRKTGEQGKTTHSDSRVQERLVVVCGRIESSEEEANAGAKRAVQEATGQSAGLREQSKLREDETTHQAQKSCVERKRRTTSAFGSDLRATSLLTDKGHPRSSFEVVNFFSAIQATDAAMYSASRVTKAAVVPHMAARVEGVSLTPFGRNGGESEGTRRLTSIHVKVLEAHESHQRNVQSAQGEISLQSRARCTPPSLTSEQQSAVRELSAVALSAFVPHPTTHTKSKKRNVMIESPVVRGIEGRGRPPVMRSIPIPIFVSRELLVLVLGHGESTSNGKAGSQQTSNVGTRKAVLGRSSSLLLAR